MKIIEAMKQIKDLQKKAEDIREKAAKFCLDLDIELPTYGTEQDQRAKLAEWAQSHRDILKEILRLRVAIQRTNLATPVSIEVNGHTATKSIAEWIHRRRDLAELDRQFYARVIQRNATTRDGSFNQSNGEQREVHVRRYFDVGEYDVHVDTYRSEPMKIDGTLEVVNAVTDLIEN